MRMRIVALLTVAVAVAGVTAFLAQRWVQQHQAQPQAAAVAAVEMPAPPPTTVDVMVVRETISAGTPLVPEHLDWVSWPVNSVPASYLVKEEVPFETVAGAVFRRDMAAGEAVVEAALVRPGSRGYLAALLEPGMRAVSIPINATSGNAGMIQPGDRVDVILTHLLGDRKDGPAGRLAGETALADVRVLAIDRVTGNQNGSVEGPRTATLEVSPKQAEMVGVAMEVGKLSLSLRSVVRDMDKEERADRSDSLADVGLTWDRDVAWALREHRPAPPPPSNGHAVMVVRGTSSEVLRFGGGGR